MLKNKSKSTIDIFSILLALAAIVSGFVLLQPGSWTDNVWSDVARMRTLNTIQSVKGKEQHLYPLQFDIVNRVIDQMSNPGDVVLDPFGGLMTVPYCALNKGRNGSRAQ